MSEPARPPRNQAPATPSREGSRLLKVLFFLSLALFAFSHAYGVDVTFQKRDIPVEADDSYSYLFQSAQKGACFFQDCPALTSLKPQVIQETEEPGLLWYRWRYYHRLYEINNLFYTTFLYNLKWITGLEWEEALRLLTVGGHFLMAVGIGIFLLALFGPGAAALATLLFSLIPLPGEPSMLLFRPFSMNVMLGFLVWGIILSPRRTPLWLAPVATILMMTVHSSGVLFAAVALGLYWFSEGMPWRGPVFKACLGSGLFVILYVILPIVVDTPPLAQSPFTPPPSPPFLEAVALNLEAFQAFLPDIFYAFGGAFFLGACVVLGLFRLNRPTLLAGGLFLALFLVSLPVIYPHHPASLGSYFLWSLFGVFLYGLAASGLWLGLSFAFHETWRAARGSYPFRRLGLLLFVLAAAGFAVVHGADTLKKGLWAKIAQINFVVHRHDLVFNPGQVEKLLALSGPEDAVLYLPEYGLLYYFGLGGLERPAVIGPLVEETPLEERYILANPALKFAVYVNPVIQGRIDLSPGYDLTVTSLNETRPPAELALRLENRGDQEIRLRIAAGSSVDLTIPAGFDGWMTTPPVTITGRSLTLSVGVDDGTLRVKGVRPKAAGFLNWPWDEALALTFSRWNKYNRRQTDTVRFQTRPLIGGACPIQRIIDDDGSLILSEIRCGPRLGVTP